MSVREEVLKYISRSRGFHSTAKMYDHFCSKGYLRPTLKSIVQRLVSSGQAIRRGLPAESEIKLNRQFKPSKRSLIQQQSHKHLAVKPEVKPQKKANMIFDLCRKHSRIYNWLDLPLRMVRS